MPDLREQVAAAAREHGLYELARYLDLDPLTLASFALHSERPLTRRKIAERIRERPLAQAHLAADARGR